MNITNQLTQIFSSQLIKHWCPKKERNIYFLHKFVGLIKKCDIGLVMAIENKWIFLLFRSFFFSIPVQILAWMDKTKNEILKGPIKCEWERKIIERMENFVSNWCYLKICIYYVESWINNNNDNKIHWINKCPLW